MTKVKLITAGKMNPEGWKKVGKSLLISLVALAIAFLGDLTNVVDFGGYHNLVLTFLPFAVNFLRKWLGTYESTI